MSNHSKSILFIVMAALIWSTSFAFTKVLLDSVPPLTIGAIRFTLAALFLWILLKLQRQRIKPTRREIYLMWGSGFLGIFVYFAFENYGVQFATASDATLIIASYPLITLVIELLMKKVAFSLPKLIGMAIAIVGVYLVVKGGHNLNSEHRGFGIVLLLIGGLIWAGYNLIASKSAGLGIEPLTMTYYQSQAGAICFAIVSFTESDQWQQYDPSDWGILVYLALACSVGAFYFYNAGLKHLSSSSAVSILNLVPIFGMAWAVVIAGESLTMIQVAGGILVMAGVFICLSIEKRVQAKTNIKAEKILS